jgi:hypothetical protein
MAHVAAAAIPPPEGSAVYARVLSDTRTERAGSIRPNTLVYMSKETARLSDGTDVFYGYSAHETGVTVPAAFKASLAYTGVANYELEMTPGVWKAHPLVSVCVHGYAVLKRTDQLKAAAPGLIVGARLDGDNGPRLCYLNAATGTGWDRVAIVIPSSFFTPTSAYVSILIAH